MLQAGENLVAVKTNNARVTDVAPLTADFTFYGGLYRDVHLVITNPLHIDTADYASRASTSRPQRQGRLAGLTARVRVTNEGPTSTGRRRTRSSTPGHDGRHAVGTRRWPPRHRQSQHDDHVAKPHLWNGGADPYLYKAYVDVSSRRGIVTDGRGASASAPCAFDPDDRLLPQRAALTCTA